MVTSLASRPFWYATFFSLMFAGSATAQTQIYFSHEQFGGSLDDPAIQKIYSDGSGQAEIIAAANAPSPIGIAIHKAAGKIYWADRSNTIRRADVDGTNSETLVAAGLSTPWGIAIDTVNSKIYWSELGNDVIKRSDLDGTNVESLGGAYIDPNYIALDLTNNKIYYAEYSQNRIRRCDLDGSNQETIISGLDYPTGVFLDLGAGKIYWGEFSGQKIGRADLDGTDQETITTGIPVWGLEKDPLLNVMYFMSNHLVKKINTDGTGLVTLSTANDFGRDVEAYDATTQAPTLTSPTNTSLWSTITVTYTLPETPTGGSVLLIFRDAGNNVASILTMDNDTSNSFSLNTTNFLATADVTASSANSISNGTYSLQLTYQDALGNTAASATATGIVVDTLTQTPVLTSPTSISTWNSINVNYTLAETPQAGTVQLVFRDAGNNIASTLTMNNTTPNTLSLNPANFLASAAVVASSVNSISNGTYSLQLKYRDALSNPVASVTATAITIDRTSPTVTISTTATSPTSLETFPVTIQFSETVTGFSVGDITVGNGVAGSVVAVDGDTYRASINPSSTGSVTVNVAAGVATDAASNGNTVATQLTMALDSDGDNIPDAQEITDGTSPLDPGSKRSTLSTSWCSEWNGFLGLYNINEYVNLISSNRTVAATIFDVAGDAVSATSVPVLAGTQTDLLVHDMSGWTPDSYGKICSELQSGSAGDVDGRMVYYKPNASGFDFAFALPYESGLSGSQFTTFNTFQPSLDPTDSADTVTNWIQITNLSESGQSGALIYYAQDGSVLATDNVTLEAEGRSDFSAHQFGANLVGMVEWRPVSATATFIMRNTRYYYDNPNFSNSFDSAMQLEGVKGNGEPLTVPLDAREKTAVLEVANTTGDQINLNVKFYDAAGDLLDTRNVALEGYGSQHIVADSILNGAIGSASVNSDSVGSALAIGMHYGRTATNGINFVYGIIGKEPLGTTLKSSYNSFLGQGCELIVANSSNTATQITISMVRLDGTEVLEGDVSSIPAKGSAAYDICANDNADQYGVVTVEASAANRLLSTIVRIGANNDYRFPTPVR